MDLKNVRRGRIKEYADKFKGATYTPVDPKTGLQSAVESQGRLRVPERHAERNQRARTLRIWSRTASMCVSEGANMPTTPEGVKVFIDHKILYGPGKAANAGGVATSGLEMSQNSMRLRWTREEVDNRLHLIMKSIHKSCVEAADRFGTPGNYVNGANIAGFLKSPMP